MNNQANVKIDTIKFGLCEKQPKEFLFVKNFLHKWMINHKITYTTMEICTKNLESIVLNFDDTNHAIFFKLYWHQIIDHNT